MILKLMSTVFISTTLFFVTSSAVQAAQPQNALAQSSNAASEHDTKRAAQLTKDARSILDAWGAAAGDVAPLQQAIALLQQAQGADAQYAPCFLQMARYNLLMRYAYRATSDDGFTIRAVVVSEMAAKHALELDPALTDAYIALADTYQVAGDLKKSAVNLDKAEQLGSKSPWLSIQRALIAARTSGFMSKTVFDYLSVALKQAETLRETKAVEVAAYGIASYYQDQRQEKMAANYLRKATGAFNQLKAQAQAVVSHS